MTSSSAPDPESLNPPDDLDACPWCFRPTPDPTAHACVALTLMIHLTKIDAGRAERARSEAPRERRRTFGAWWGEHPELAELDAPTDDDELPEPF